MDIYSRYRLQRNGQGNNYLGEGSAIDNYILAKWQHNKRRIILDPDAYDAAIHAAAADIKRQVLNAFK